MFKDFKIKLLCVRYVNDLKVYNIKGRNMLSTLQTAQQLQ